jgi:hypothetical protein
MESDAAIFSLGLGSSALQTPFMRVSLFFRRPSQASFVASTQGENEKAYQEKNQGHRLERQATLRLAKAD